MGCFEKFWFQFPVSVADGDVMVITCVWESVFIEVCSAMDTRSSQLAKRDPLG